MPFLHILLNLREYHRPSATTGGLQHALELLARPNVRTVPLAGGDVLLGSGDPAVEAVVDLQDLGLDELAQMPAPMPALKIGAMVTRSRLAADAAARTVYDGIVAEGARRWGGNVQRNRATVGGAIAVGASSDPLLVALLACDAQVGLVSRQGPRHLSLADFLACRAQVLAEPALITEVRVSLPSALTAAALVSVARTPADTPIVVAAAVLAAVGGRCEAVGLALGGVAPTPVRLSAIEPTLLGRALAPDALPSVAEQVVESVTPAGDFRGSAEYRQAMAGVLAQRAVAQAWQRLAELTTGVRAESTSA